MLPHLEDLDMKNRIFVALLLAGVLALPALAQTSSTTQDQPAAAQSTDQSSTASTTGASGKPAAVM